MATFPMADFHTAARYLAEDFHTAASHLAADLPAARRPASTPARSAASIMGASRMDFRPAEVRVLVVGSTVAEAGTLEEEEGTDEHQTNEGDGNDA